MKYIYCQVLLYVFLPFFVFSQVITNDTSTALLFSSSDHPAYKVLGLESSELLRPTPNLSPVTGIISGVSNNYGFGIEIAPFIKNNSGLIRSRLFESSKFSIAYSSKINNSSSVGLGYQVSLIPRRRYYLNNLARKLETNSYEDFLLRDQIALEFAKIKGKPIYLIKEDPDLLKELNDYVDLKINQNNGLNKKETILDNWNIAVINYGIAVRLTSSNDSTFENIKAQVFSLWLSFGFPIGKNGQLIGGYNFSTNDFKNKYNTFSSSLRLYQGSNALKGFLEAQYKADIVNNFGGRSWLFNMGGEIKLYNGIWLDLQIGLVNTEAVASLSQPRTQNFVSRLNLRITTPKLFANGN